MATYHLSPTADCASTLTDAIASLPDDSTVCFAPGTYHFWPDHAPRRRLMMSNTDSLAHPIKPIGLLLEGRRGLTLRGDGATLMLHGSMMAIGLLACENIRLSGFTIAHHAPTVIDATVFSSTHGTESTEAVAAFPSVYPFSVKNQRIHWEGERSPYTGKSYWQGVNGLDLTQRLRTDGSVQRTKDDLFRNLVSVEKWGTCRVRLRYAGHRDIAPGDVFQMRHTARDTCGIHVANCRDIAFSQMWVQFMCGMGLVAQCSDTLAFDGMRFEAAGAPFYSASAADMLHFSGCRGTIAIRDCRFINPHDDPINVHGTFLGVDRAEGRHLSLRFMHAQTCGFAPFAAGDQLQLYRAEPLLPEGPAYTILAVDGPAEKSPATLNVMLDAAPKCPPGMRLVADNLSAQPNVWIERNTFVSIPTRGILVSTMGKVVIRENNFSRVRMPCVYIACDAEGWYESGPVRDVRIESNRFADCGAEAVRIEPTNRVLSAEKVHRNVRIIGNAVTGLPFPPVFARSTGTLSIRKNTVHAPAAPDAPIVKAISCEVDAAENTTKAR